LQNAGPPHSRQTVSPAASFRSPSIIIRTTSFIRDFAFCGAVEAALATRNLGASQPTRIARLLDSIIPALAGVDPTLEAAAQLSAGVEANVRWSMGQLLGTPEGQARIKEGVVKLVGAVYELETGRVRFLE
jgi:carbonic anhydrase